MNVYDFDKTIYNGDSTADFLFFCASRRREVRALLPSVAADGAAYVLGILPKQRFKEKMFRFLCALPDTDAETEAFWAEHITQIKPWYKEKQRSDDVIISASPQFLLEPVCRTLGISCLMASPVDKNTGLYRGANCHGEEKVRRYREVFGDAPVGEFYSDSKSDAPLARIAERAYIVKGNRISLWNP